MKIKQVLLVALTMSVLSGCASNGEDLNFKEKKSVIELNNKVVQIIKLEDRFINTYLGREGYDCSDQELSPSGNYKAAFALTKYKKGKSVSSSFHFINKVKGEVNKKLTISGFYSLPSSTNYFNRIEDIPLKTEGLDSNIALYLPISKEVESEIYLTEKEDKKTKLKKFNYFIKYSTSTEIENENKSMNFYLQSNKSYHNEVFPYSENEFLSVTFKACPII